ncbi:hypothetical protein A3A46_01480 [Candidatus Roizmanbacteria bacterium RIFCSPLOWO2_01_FULL_37_13]|uniref:Uncharacterized protein n=1 Tax=Candidatus Roizmanbacteria bacterium RIFCSPHIGHO2_02_FULL_38_11 TaxID=1802039 RepID=A0A1F7H1E8_9BACT|nr:MAG: hypothetical protein A3C25_01780 [Candidatus Roizmanbacteria bacterium RIFCSPHIGHO2_02_FULL_38_11]OGK34058.1 MAG: hypothetical protein A3F58_04445 [Candidatus Roizmanbacteria bacterium RIFCSPHIGHO2_12_FULL_37_9b]OGK42540.1 MAG: hypothetical protein A3A46_01480 [Candidatus Roizmanbacteria bacterium RIFCSPLOWO2_01_FULL_37_13]
MLRTFYTIFLVISFSLIGRLEDSPLFFIMLSAFVFAMLINFKLIASTVYFIQQDIKRYSFNKQDFLKRLILAEIWVAAVFIARNAGGAGWLFGALDDGTLLFFSLLGLLVLLKSSSTTSALLSVVAITYAAFFTIYKFEKTGDLFTILTFYFFTWAVIQAFRKSAII